jgi:hypothetical protein
MNHTCPASTRAIARDSTRFLAPGALACVRVATTIALCTLGRSTAFYTGATLFATHLGMITWADRAQYCRPFIARIASPKGRRPLSPECSAARLSGS